MDGALRSAGAAAVVDDAASAEDEVVHHRCTGPGTLARHDAALEGSGRTDSGVHAHAQVFHFDAAWTHGAEKLRKALHTGLPRSIRLKTLRQVRPDFHARFDAKGKIYRYHLNLGEADPFEVNYCWSLNREGE